MGVEAGVAEVERLGEKRQLMRIKVQNLRDSKRYLA